MKVNLMHSCNALICVVTTGILQDKLATVLEHVMF